MSRFGSIREVAGAWRAFYVYGKKRHTPGHTFTQKRHAERWLSNERHMMDLGTWTPPAERRASEQAAELEAAELGRTLDDYAREWLEQRIVKREGKPLSPRYREECERYLRGILAELAAKPMASITPTDVATWHAEHGDTPTLRARAYSFGKTVCNTAVSRELIQRNPFNIENAGAVATAKESGKIVKQLGADQIRIIADNVRPAHKLIILLCAWCGLRSGEAFALRRSDLKLDKFKGVSFYWVSVERGIVTHSGGRHEAGTKTGRLGERTIPVPPHLTDEITDHLGKYAAPGRDGLLFPGDGQYSEFTGSRQVYGWSTEYRADGSVRKRGAGLYHARIVAEAPEATLHTLRHWAATRWALLGAPDPLRRALLGHAEPGITGRYTHPLTTTRQAIKLAFRLSRDA